MTSTVEIPADVKDNNTHTVRIQWRGVRNALPNEVESGKQHLDTFGYTMHEWDDVDRKGRRVTLTRFVNRQGESVDLFETSYYTRVKCASCEYRWAEAFTVFVDIDGKHSDTVPYCGDHLSAMHSHARHLPGTQLLESEPLRIGQH